MGFGFDLESLSLYTKYGASGTTKGETTSITATPHTVTFDEAAQTQQITVVNQNGTTLTDYLTFTSSNTKTTVSATGLITSVTSGTSTITITYSEPDDTPLTDTIGITTTVTESVTINGNSSPYSLHETEYVSLTVENQVAKELTYECKYYSSDTNVAIFELIDNPTVRFLTAGTTTLSAVHDITNITGTTILTLTNELITSLVQIANDGPGPVVMTATGETFQCIIQDQEGHDVTSIVEYTSDDASFSVNATGLITGVSLGTATITISKTYPLNTITTTVDCSYTA